MGKLYRIWKSYPVLKSMLSYGSIYTGADIVDQIVIDRHKRPYDGLETLRRSLAGCIFIGPLNFTWVRIAERIFSPSRTFVAVARRVLVEQVVFGPIAITTFYCANNLFERRSLKESWEELHEKFFKTYEVRCMYFPFVQFINYKYVPPDRRLLFLSSATFMWSTFMCYMKSLPIHERPG
ncbi:mpv17-like protein [Lingula anatina]|uniref:Mpv17-like protein n=1 Tax=Lingula anatina TaxID=7574 RepID=A0A1S3H8E9_LINAN|nr:mpv17-like protein [Lingula anatina]|eukprot:XP_013381394.1 mpv17-like protein [Lingula anatina]